ncbi:MAG: pseudouridine synthase [Myxococcota bacterium]
MRLDRWIANRTGASRRIVDRAIRAGQVTVDGVEVRDAGAPVGPEAKITVDGEPLPEPPPRLALFHKPLGVHSTVGDPHGRPNLEGAAADLVDRGLHPVGRLDAETDGLLLFSSDGALTQWLLHPRRQVVRVYRAVVEGAPAPELGGRLAAGIDTADGTWAAELRSVDGQVLVVAVTEGKHRMVRRLLANAGHPVVELRRLSYGPFILGDLAPGGWRVPTETEWAGVAGAPR